MSSDGSVVVVDTVGSLLATIANSIQDALRILMFADKRAWGPPEFEQLRLLEEALDEAKRDFQDLPVLVNGRFYYENDPDSLDELRELCARFEEHSQNLKYWIRAGGPIETEWATETRWLRRELHRAQCRAVRRIHDDLEGSSSRCLGALIVWRSQHQQEFDQPQPEPHSHSPHLQQHRQHSQRGVSTTPTTLATELNLRPTGEITACNSTGTFQRLGPGNRDIAFVCDFCDGFIVWEDLRSMPSTRQRLTTSSENRLEDWAATGFTHPRSHSHSNKYPSISGPDSDVELEDGNSNPRFGSTTGQTITRGPETELEGEEKTIIFPPVAIANHLPPELGEWQAPLLCPLCDEYYYEEQGDDDMDRVRWTQDERGFESVALLQEHFEWTHASLIPSLANVAPKSSSCEVM
ncbi:hypothetical protein GQX73_g10072 [Xylaria multiplex]|uniref:Uncharacterized protein n=1 Tax=Xylaria multiplex TaxID=323545 RepID=A0A7C8MR66_9PEZI|nr:hypothetical protein GQX73_g10072 [Xylaria multiplex]